MSDWALWSYTKSGFADLREELAGVAASLEAGDARHKKAMRGLKHELESMRGNVEARLNALTNSYMAFVELDGIRKQLESFPQEAVARRHAHEDLATLLAGRVPPPRDDLPGYWLVPAVKALNPDGSVDREQAAIAQQRDRGQATMFLAVAQAALGAGPSAMQDVDDVLAPAEDGTWDEAQLILWLVTLRGAFGDQAVATLDGIIRPVVRDAHDWLSWAETTSSAKTAAEALAWVTTHLEELAPAPDWAASGPVALPNYSRDIGTRTRPWAAPSRRIGAEPEGAEATANMPGPDFVAPDQPLGGTAPQTEANALPGAAAPRAPEEGATPAPTPEDEDQATHQMLVKILRVLIGRGTEPERELLARAAVLEEQFTNPRGAVEVPSEVPEPRHAVLKVLRDSATDDKAHRAHRFWIWRLIGEALLPEAQQFADELPPLVPVVNVQGDFGLSATPDGLTDASALRTAQQSLDAQEPTGIVTYGWHVMAAAGVLGIVLVFFVAQHWMLWFPVLGCLVAGVWGHAAATKTREIRASLVDKRERLDQAVAKAIATAARRQVSQHEEHQQRRTAGQELIASMQRIRRMSATTA